MELQTTQDCGGVDSKSPALNQHYVRGLTIQIHTLDRWFEDTSRRLIDLERVSRERTNDIAAVKRIRTTIDAHRKRLNILVDTHLYAYATPRCQALCDMVQQKLPRELRDMIYHYLLEEDSHLSGRIHHGSAPATMSIVGSRSAHVGQYISAHPLASDLFRRADLLGEETVCEVTETWCRDTNFTINIKDLPDLRNILMRTIVAPQLTAATLIRNVTLIIPHKIWGEPQLHFHEKLEHLSALRPRTTISFFFDNGFDPDGYRYHYFLNMTKWSIRRLSGAFPIIAHLRASGHTVNVYIVRPEVNLSEVELNVDE